MPFFDVIIISFTLQPNPVYKCKYNQCSNISQHHHHRDLVVGRKLTDSCNNADPRWSAGSDTLILLIKSLAATTALLKSVYTKNMRILCQIYRTAMLICMHLFCYMIIILNIYFFVLRLSHNYFFFAMQIYYSKSNDNPLILESGKQNIVITPENSIQVYMCQK